MAQIPTETSLRRTAEMHRKIAAQLEEMLIGVADGKAFNPEEDVLTREWDRQQRMAYEADALADDMATLKGRTGTRCPLCGELKKNMPLHLNLEHRTNPERIS